MSDYLTLQRTLIKKTLFFALAAACICLAFDQKAAAKGIALGSIFSVADFKLMAFLLPRRLVVSAGAAFILASFADLFCSVYL
jgi:hypothetical protein